MAGAIRPGFEKLLADLYSRRKVKSSPSWVYFKISEHYGYQLSSEEILCVCVKLGFKSGWAYYKEKEQPERRREWLKQTGQQIDPEPEPVWQAPAQPTFRSFEEVEAINLLGLRLDYTVDELTKSFRSKALVNHPDRGGNADVFIKITKAYKLLKGTASAPLEPMF